MSIRAVLWCARQGCAAQIVGYGFADAANPPTSIAGPWLCLFCAAQAAKQRPGDITQAFTTEPVPPGSVWTFPAEPLRTVVVVEDEAAEHLSEPVTITGESVRLAQRLARVSAAVDDLDAESATDERCSLSELNRREGISQAVAVLRDALDNTQDPYPGKEIGR